MENLIFTSILQSSAENLWFCLWNEFQYKKWVSVFKEGSYAVSEWKQGARIHFMSPEGHGMYSDIETWEPNKAAVFRHIGNIKNGIEIEVDDATKSWSGMREGYRLTEHGNQVQLEIRMDINSDYKSYFESTFPKAIDKIKNNIDHAEIVTQIKMQGNVHKIWDCWTNPIHIIKWNTASPEWHTPKADIDLRVQGRFTYRMEAKDGSFGFDFGGVYTEIINHQLIAYTMDDGRRCKVQFDVTGDIVTITQSFDPESQNAYQLQYTGWQTSLDNFKSYAQQLT